MEYLKSIVKLFKADLGRMFKTHYSIENNYFEFEEVLSWKIY